MSLNKSGRVYLVGAGCGDYDLITLRGKELLEQCEVVVYDSLIDDRVLDFVPENAEKICVGKRSGKHSEKQENINRILVKSALKGKTVVRLKGGDPFVFGRGGEEILELKKNNIEYSVIPGISSAVAVPEMAGIPVTHRKISRSFHIITAHTAENVLPENMREYSKIDGTLVFLMGLEHLKEISESLIKNGKSPLTPATVISDGASSRQKIVKGTLENIYQRTQVEKLLSPSTIVVGNTAKFDFLPTVSMPLKEISVTVTGTRKFSGKLSKQLERLGAETYRLDNMNVVEYRNNLIFDDALKNIKKYNWLVLTSINGAEIFFRRLIELGIDIRSLYGIKTAVIGSGTADVLREKGIIADLIPEKYTSKSLGEKISEHTQKGEKILILRAENGSLELTEIFDKNGISYNDVKIYNVISENNFEKKVIDTDFITFASSSGVSAFFRNGFEIAEKTKIICIGNITAKTLKNYGINKFYISKNFTADGITDTIIKEIQK